MKDKPQGLTKEEEDQNDVLFDIRWAIGICKRANAQGYVYSVGRWGIHKISLLSALDVEILRHRLYANDHGYSVSLDLLEYGITWGLAREDMK